MSFKSLGRVIMFQLNGHHAQGNGNGHGRGTALLNGGDEKSLRSSPIGEAAEKDLCALVGANTEFKGVIRYNGTVRIDGMVEGEIYTNGVLLVGQDAVIRATVSAGAIVSCGKIFGDVTATEGIKLIAPAVLKGSATTPLLSMEEGVCFRGSLQVTMADEENPAYIIQAMKAVAGAN